MPDGSTMSIAPAPRARRSTSRNPDARLIALSEKIVRADHEIDVLSRPFYNSDTPEPSNVVQKTTAMTSQLCADVSALADVKAKTFKGLRAKADALKAFWGENLREDTELAVSMLKDVIRLVPADAPEPAKAVASKRHAKNPDTRLIKLCQQMIEYQNTTDKLDAKTMTIDNPVPQGWDSHADYFSALAHESRQKFIQIRAKTFEGISAKAQALAAYWSDDDDAESNDPFSWSIVQDILKVGQVADISAPPTSALASVVQSPDKKLIDLVTEYFNLKAELHAGYDRVEGKGFEAAHAFEVGECVALLGRMNEIENSVTDLAPQTLEGFAAKARVAERILLFYHGYIDGTPPEPTVITALSLCRDLVARVSGTINIDFPTDPIGDADLVRLCDQHIANHAEFNARAGEVPNDEDPRWHAYERTSEAISHAKPRTLAGLAAKARAIRVEATHPNGEVWADDEVPWMWDLVNDLIRLDGERRPDAAPTQPDTEIIAIAQQAEAAEQKIYDYNKDLIQMTQDEVFDVLDIGHKAGLRLLSMRPTTAAGFMAKARAVRMAMENLIATDPGETVESMGEFDQRLAWSLVNDIVGGSPIPLPATPHPDADLLAKASACVERNKWIWGNQHRDEDMGGILDSHIDTLCEIAESPAVTVDGLRAKALALREYWSDEPRQSPCNPDHGDPGSGVLLASILNGLIMMGDPAARTSAAAAHSDGTLITLCEEFSKFETASRALHDGPNAIQDDDEAEAADRPNKLGQRKLLDPMRELRATTLAGYFARTRAIFDNGNILPDEPEALVDSPYFNEALLGMLLRDLAEQAGIDRT